jgi:CYTH domain-containing protein
VTVEPRYEIERRYLVRVAPELWSRLGTGHAYRQGYLRGRTSVRIRFGEPRGPVLTCKSGSGVKRREVESVVPGDVAEALMEAAGKRVIEKTRWALGPWELDRFTGPLEGLTLLEIELEAVDDPIPGSPTGVHILREVTDDKRFTSSNLAHMSKKEQKRFVKTAYGEVEDA